MKRVIAYIILAVFLVNNTNLDQLLKLPTLVIHYQEHHRLNEDLSISDFLCMHYMTEDDKDDDNDRDMQLPYKTVDVHALQHIYVPLAKTVAVKQQQESYVIPVKNPVLKDCYLPEPALSSLFRPPQA